MVKTGYLLKKETPKSPEAKIRDIDIALKRTPRIPRKSAEFKIPIEYKTDVIDALDNWLKSYKSKFNDKTNRQRKRIQTLMGIIDKN